MRARDGNQVLAGLFLWLVGVLCARGFMGGRPLEPATAPLAPAKDRSLGSDAGGLELGELSQQGGGYQGVFFVFAP